MELSELSFKVKPTIYKTCCCELEFLSLCGFDDEASNLDLVEKSLNKIVVKLPKTSPHVVLKHLITLSLGLYGHSTQYRICITFQSWTQRHQNAACQSH